MATLSAGQASVKLDALASILMIVTVLAAMLTLYLVGFDQGAVSRSGMYLHELMHDGRHLMGVPCH
ncbi:hypothetical protein CBI38_31895 (plasmid) [Rhodococcus oxybenzonivorans]|jgi:hypothetical protein|uniref:Cobalt transporter subunit CbtB n=1 Tax=Rhodococcus oxybenzonivorans TaxID=1990687 RepID=A0A2S2C5G3_9NOCA|nr:CbtB domain-containing protein [Rhodococcus oxybenzonivorans]AWK76126.1 hypothetical protein CBI38_31895 [Rhodococcus oxybenzonivorans]